MAATPFLTAQVIIFSINSAIKLSQNLRKAYAHSLRAKALVLPLPDFDPNVKLFTVMSFFNAHPEYLDELERLKELHEKANTALDLEEEEKKEYLEFYFSLHAGDAAEGIGLEMAPSDMLALLKIRQWEKGKAPSSVLQLVAGTMVEIGIDYFNQLPGALHPDSVQGRLMQKFLGAFDGISLAENAEIKKELSVRLLPRLFTVAAESLADISTEIAADEKVQAFIQATARGIANDIYQRAAGLNAEQREEAIHWGQLVLRSMIHHAGHYVVAAPQSIFGTNQPVSRIIESTGLVLLDAILDDDSDQVVFKNALSPESLDRLTHAALSVVAEHPQVISGERGLKEIISAVAAVAKDQKVSDKGFLPELARIVLEQSAGRLDLFWRETPQGAEHLLVSALGQILGALSENRDGEKWKPTLSKSQLLGMVEELVDDVARNPAWILDEVQGRPALAEVLEATFGALGKLPRETRLTAEALRSVVRVVMQTALVNRRVLDKVHWGADQEETIILDKALNLIFAFAFAPEVTGELNRMSLVADLLDYTLEVVLRKHPEENGLILLDLILFNSGIDYRGGFDRHLADQLIDAALGALATRPELAAQPEALRHIISGVAKALDSSNIKQPGLLSKLIQLLLQHAAQNTQVILPVAAGQPKHLLLTALEYILKGLAATDHSGRWRPTVSPAMAESLIEDLMEEVIRNPYWITDKWRGDVLLIEVLDAVFPALEQIPAGERFSPQTLQAVIRHSLQVVASSPRVLQKIHFGEDQQEKEILRRALEIVMAYVFPADPEKGYRAFLLADLLEYILEVLMSRYPDERGLILIDLILAEQNGIDYSRGFKREMAEQLVESAAAVLSRHPDLLTEHRALQHIIANLAAVLHTSGLEQPDLLPELIRLTLLRLADRMELLLDGDRANSRHLLVLAAGQVMKALAQPSPDGRWKPRLTNEQLLEILSLVYDAVLDNPQWAQQDSIIFSLLEGIFTALYEGVPEHLTIPYGLIRSVVEKVVKATSRQRQLLAHIETADGKTALRMQVALDRFIIVLYQENGAGEIAWYLAQVPIVDTLLDYFFSYISSTPVQAQDIEDAAGRLRQAIATWKEDFSQNLSDILKHLEDFS